MSKVILLGGKKRVGKDTATTIIKKSLEDKGHSVASISFAQPIKDIICTLFDMSSNDLDQFKNNPHKFWIEVMNSDNLTLFQTDFRRILQLLGTECRDKFFGRNIWVDMAKRNILASRADYVIISDWRFPFEYESILGDFDTKTLIITRDTGIVDEHISETALESFLPDYHLTNNLSIQEFHDKLLRLVDNF